MSLRAVALASAALLGLAGCTGTTHGAAAGPPPAAAHLEPCPAAGAAVAGSALPDVVTGCLGSGPRVRLAGLRGPLVLNAWGSWCGPCQAEVPALQAFHVRAGSRVPLLGIDVSDDRASALDFAAHVGMTYPSVVDDDDRTRGFRGTSTPETLLVDATGRVVHRVEGPVPGADGLAALVQRYLGVRV